MTDAYVYIPRSAYHLSQVRVFLQSHGVAYVPIPSPIGPPAGAVGVGFDITHAGHLYSCEYLSPGLLRVSSPPGVAPGPLDVGRGFYESLAASMWPGVSRSLVKGRLSVGSVSFPRPVPLSEAMVAATLNYVERNSEFLRATLGGTFGLRRSYLLVCEVGERLAQAKTSMDLFDLVISRLHAITLGEVKNQIEFSSLFASVRRTALEFEVQHQTRLWTVGLLIATVAGVTATVTLTVLHGFP